MAVVRQQCIPYRRPSHSAVFLRLAGRPIQTSLTEENSTLSTFHRFGGNITDVEGWALYSDSRGRELGTYNDPKQMCCGSYSQWVGIDDSRG